MSFQIESGSIKKMPLGSNLTYILDDRSVFLSIEYKVLQSQSDSCFVKCMKMLFNGRIQLFYMTNTFRPLSLLLPTLDADRFMIIATNLLSDIIDVKNNGFLACENINISLDNIYVDMTTYKVHLVYLPISKRLFDSYTFFENELRSSLVKIISNTGSISSPQTAQFSSNLTDGTLSLEGLYSQIKNGNTVGPPTYHPINTSSGTVHMIATNAPARFEIVIDKDEFVIGKSEAQVDGFISFNKAISRKHCKICRSGNQYTISDLDSANGTFVNKRRLQPYQPHPIKHGDVVRLANSYFQIEIR